MIQSYAGMPKVRQENDPLVQRGLHPSGEYAWKVLENITQKPHSYNTLENLRVRQYLIDTLVEIKNDFDANNCSQSNPLEVFGFNIVCR